VQIIQPVDLTDASKGEDLLRLDLLTPLRLTRAVVPAMIARGSGTIVDVASMAAITPMVGMFYYNAAKAGLAAASEALRGELRGTGVHVVTVYPGPVDTDMGRAGFVKYEETLSAKIAPVGTAAELARLVRRAVEKKKARVIYPRFYAITRYVPNLARWFTLRFSPPLRRDAAATQAPAVLKE
jgi:short-subunit dehydrogenase